VAVDAGAFVQEVIAADYFGFGIRQERVGVVGFAAEILGLPRGIDADGDGPDAKLFKIGETFLNTP
jgi:hypothetical protein